MSRVDQRIWVACERIRLPSPGPLAQQRRERPTPLLQRKRALCTQHEASGSILGSTAMSCIPDMQRLGGWKAPLAQQQRRAFGLCCSTSSGDLDRPASVCAVADSEHAQRSSGEEVSAEEVEKKLRKAAALIATADELAPYDPRTFNAALLIW